MKKGTISFEQKIGKDILYCKKELKNNNYNQYVLSQFIPINKRPYFFCFSLFFEELKLIMYKTNKRELGLFQMNYWKENILKIKDEKTNESLSDPVSTILGLGIKSSRLKSELLVRLIEGLEWNFGNKLNVSSKDYSCYIDSIYGSYCYQLRYLLNSVEDRNIEAFCYEMGQFIGKTESILEIKQRAKNNLKPSIPLNIMNKYDINQQQLYNQFKLNKHSLDAKFRELVNELSVNTDQNKLNINNLYNKLGQNTKKEIASVMLLKSVYEHKIKYITKHGFNLNNNQIYTPKNSQKLLLLLKMWLKHKRYYIF